MDKNSDNDIIGMVKDLKSFANKHSFTLKNIANILDVNFSLIHYWYVGKKVPNTINQIKIKELLWKTEDELPILTKNKINLQLELLITNLKMYITENGIKKNKVRKDLKISYATLKELLDGNYKRIHKKWIPIIRKYLKSKLELKVVEYEKKIEDTKNMIKDLTNDKGKVWF